MPIRVAINGFGRIGRATLRSAFERDAGVEWVAINDLVDIPTAAHLLRRDSVYGRFDQPVETTVRGLVIDGHEVPVLQEQDPAALPWRELGVDVVIESTGVFRTRDAAAAHLVAGARKVIVSAPAKDALPTFVLSQLRLVRSRAR